MKSKFLWLLLFLLLIYIGINLKKYEGYTGYTQSQFVNYPDNNIRTFSIISDGDCKISCNKTSGCVGYVTEFIEGWGPGKCSLKSKMDPKEAIRNDITISNIRY